MSTEKEPTFIKFSKEGIHYAFHARSIQEKNGMFSWYIPAFDIFFSSKDRETGRAKAKSMTESFFTYWIGQESFRAFILQIHKLGFKSPNHDLTVSEMIKRKRSDAKFTSKNEYLPEGFLNSESIVEEGELAMAI